MPSSPPVAALAQRQHVLAAVSLALAATVAAALMRRRRHNLRARAPPTGVIFTGTGCSSAMPMVRCALGDGRPGCRACPPALRYGWRDPNWRGNVGILIRFAHPDGRQRHVQIDVGKTFREAVLRWYTAHGVGTLDAVILTHDHADAIFGMDDLRSVQRWDPKTRMSAETTRVYSDRRTLATLRKAFPYLFPTPAVERPGGFAEGRKLARDCPDCSSVGEVSVGVNGSANGGAANGASNGASNGANGGATNGGGPPGAARSESVEKFGALEQACVCAPTSPVQRYVASLQWLPFPEDTTAPFEVDGLVVHPLPVLHGKDYVSYGFGFGGEGRRVVYLSDYTALLPATEALLGRWTAAPDAIDLLVLDALSWDKPSPVHANVEISIALARRLAPRKALLVGMGHDFEHRAANRVLRRLRADGLDIQLARDGELVEVPLAAGEVCMSVDS